MQVRVLSYTFAVNWDWEEAGAYVRFSMARFLDEAHRRDSDVEQRKYSFTSSLRTYSLDCDGDRIIESPDQRDVLNQFSWHVNSTAMRDANDRLVIHAGALATPDGRGVLLPGPSGSGKTSLVAELVRSGFGYLSDEAAGIDPGTGRLLPYPKALSIKQGMFERFIDTVDKPRAWPISGRMWLVDPDTLRIGAVAGPATVEFVIFPAHRPGASTRVTPISAAEAVVALHENVANRAIVGAHALTILGGVVKGTAAYRLETSDPGEAVRAVRELTDR